MDRVFDDKKANLLIELLNKAKSDSSIESYIYIKNMLDNIIIPLPRKKIVKGTRLVRCRSHLKGKDFFKSINEISYIRDISKIKEFGRANEPGQSMFYCSDNLDIAFIETSRITRENIAKDFEYMTKGVWEVYKDLIAVNIISHDEIRGENTIIDSMSKKFEDLIKKEGTPSGKVVLKILRFFSKEFTRNANGNPNNYKISCAFSNYIFNNFPKIDGILYPSSLYNKDGVNIVFKPTSVDEKLKFYIARRGKMKKTSTTKYHETDIIDSEIHGGDGEKINWPIDNSTLKQS